MNELVNDIKDGKLDSFWTLCTAGISMIYQLCRLNKVPDEDMEIMITKCVRTTLFDFDKIMSENNIYNMISDEFEAEFHKRYPTLKVELKEESKVFSGDDVPEDVMSGLTMTLGIYNRNSEVAKQFMSLYGKDSDYNEADRTGRDKNDKNKKADSLVLGDNDEEAEESLSDFVKGNKTAILVALLIVIVLGGAVSLAGLKMSEKKTKGNHDMELNKETEEDTSDINAAYEELYGVNYSTEADWQYESGDVSRFEGIVFPAVHDESNGECIFIWNKTEEDVRAWMDEQYGEYMVEHKSVSENVGNNIIDMRVYNESRVRKEDMTDENSDIEDSEILTGTKRGKTVDMMCCTQGYSSVDINSINFSFESDEVDEVIKEVTHFLEWMGFGEYAEDIIKTATYTEIIINTENGLGNYCIYTVYQEYGIENSKKYNLCVSIAYEDKYYENNEIILSNIASRESIAPISQWFSASKFDTTEILTFSKDLNKYISGAEEGNYTYENWINVEGDSLFNGMDNSYEFYYYNQTRYDSISIDNRNALDEYIHVTVRPYEYYKILGYENMNIMSTLEIGEYTEETAKKIAKSRVEILKMINDDFDFNVEEIMENLEKNWDKQEILQEYMDKEFENENYIILLKNAPNAFELKICPKDE